MAGAFLTVGFIAAIGFCVHSLRVGEIISALALFGFALACLGAGAALAWPMVSEGAWWTVTCPIDPWPIVTTYIGLALAGAMFLSIGLFVSSLVNSQMIAAIVSLFIGLLFIGGMWSPELDTTELPYKIVFFFSVPMHFERHFGRGLLDTRHLVLYGSVALFGLFLTVRSLESRRWQ